MAQTLPEMKAATLVNILGDVQVEALIDTLADTLAVSVAKKLGHTLGDVKVDALPVTQRRTP